MAEKPNKLKARLPRGLADRGPAEIAATRRMVEAIRAVFERYGFEGVETPEQVADVIGKALQFVPRQRLLPCTNCGMAPMSREVALRKLNALAQGAALARTRHG